MIYNIQRDSPIPAYYQIALDLRQRIARGEWRVGQQLPAEPELAAMYDVSRMTLRQAVAELVADGLLERRRGDGTYVSGVYLDVDYRPLHERGNAPGGAGGEKGELRRAVWAELRRVAVPDSRFHWNFEQFVPDFAGSERCVTAIRAMPEYQSSRVLFVAPDNSLTALRERALVDGKIVIVATYAITRGFAVLEPGAVPAADAAFAATLDGLERHGRFLSLAELEGIGPVDLLVTGISLVTGQGVRWGKGHGYFDLEWGILRHLDLVWEETPVIAVGHDCQVVTADLKPSAVDTIVDIIVTPSRVIQVRKVFPKPPGILWEYVSAELRGQIGLLAELAARRS